MLCSLVMAATVCAAGAETTKREAFEGCLGAGIDKFKDLCEPADLVARAILFECKPQLYDRSCPGLRCRRRWMLALSKGFSGRARGHAIPHVIAP